LGNIENYEEVCFDEYDYDKKEGTISTLTDSMVWMTMLVDMGQITEKNWEEFFLRTQIWERLNGSMMVKFVEGEQVHIYITPQDVKNYIGLSTNVAYLSDAKFRKKIWDFTLMANAKEELNRKVKETVDV